VEKEAFTFFAFASVSSAIAVVGAASSTRAMEEYQQRHEFIKHSSDL